MLKEGLEGLKGAEEIDVAGYRASCSKWKRLRVHSSQAQGQLCVRIHPGTHGSCFGRQLTLHLEHSHMLSAHHMQRLSLCCEGQEMQPSRRIKGLGAVVEAEVERVSWEMKSVEVVGELEYGVLGIRYESVVLSLVGGELVFQDC